MSGLYKNILVALDHTKADQGLPERRRGSLHDGVARAPTPAIGKAVCVGRVRRSHARAVVEGGGHEAVREAGPRALALPRVAEKPGTGLGDQSVLRHFYLGRRRPGDRC